MLKNKSKIITVFLIALLLFFVPMSFADEGTDVAPISEEATSQPETGAEETVNANQEIENTMKNIKTLNQYFNFFIS